jgi:hypothetical protein
MDFSEADNRRAREIVQLFSQADSRDELGVGLIRDVFSNLLFPGVSVIQTRARYLLFVPWLFQAGEQRRLRGAELLRWVDKEERKLIETLRKGGDLRGLIGVEARQNVKILPSSIYWSALSSYGICRWPGSKEQLAAAARREALSEDALTELVARSGDAWDSSMPKPPTGFPSLPSLDFTLPADERDWLKERLLASTSGSLLHWLVLNDVAPQETNASGRTNWAWTEPGAAGAPLEVQRVLRHAEMFSLALHGSALLYNLLLARRADELSLPIETSDYEQALDEWWEQVADSSFPSWDVNDFWTLVTDHYATPIPRTQVFVNRWIDVLRRGGPSAPALRDEASTLIRERERDQKKGRARLYNDKMMLQWTGASGAGRLSYRWFQVVRMLNDLNSDVVDDV